LLVRPDGKLQSSFRPPRILVAQFFGRPVKKGYLPSKVCRWLKRGKPAMLVAKQGKAQLCIRSYQPHVPRSIPLLVELYAHGLRDEARKRGDLTPREQEVMELLVCGKTEVEIALMLAIALSTVRKHLEHIYPKLLAKTRRAAVDAYGRMS
jgi:DNA-binding NarL/FixJ family response regulator